MNTEEYKGYVGHFSHDVEDGVYAGVVIGIRDVVTFQSDSEAGINQAFRESVDDYLEFCAEQGVEPNKPVIGTE